ncbi:hypothetical protein VE03_08901 [Pseudogymnoascus sp. 23342-1-I1]|nr:hypothetical protein VE03_08901 [Pseudogymnoascus sp. 23342-1-I1]
MVSTARRRDPRDGRTLRTVDEAFWARERDMLSMRLSMLKDFLAEKGIVSDTQLHAEECRYLEYQIQSVQASLASTGDDTSAHDALEARLANEPASQESEKYKDWLANNQEFKTLMLSHQTEGHGDGDIDEGGEGAEVVVGGKYKCCEPACKHYVYGFETVKALRRHMGLHEEAEEARRRASGVGVDEGADGDGGEGGSEGEHGGVNGGNGSVMGNGNGNGDANGFGGVPGSPLSTRTALLPTPEAEGKRRGGGRLSLPAGAEGGGGGVRMSGPCLRCKVLKKKCDCLKPCKECPLQDVMAPDLWKALGCFHGSLTTMIKCLEGFKSPPQSSPGGDATGTNDITWAAEIDYLMKTHPGFVTLEDAFWDSRDKLALNSADVMDTTRDLADVEYKRLLHEYGPAVGLLKMAMLDRAYMARTAYNPFALLRVGKNVMAVCNDPPNWHVYTLAHTLLTTVLHYRLSLLTTPPTSSPPLHPPLTAFLLAFDARFSTRKELPPSAWLAAFHSLCLFSITKSLLIDTPRPHQADPSKAAARLMTTHKILVSVFAWSAKLSNWCPKEPFDNRDPLLRTWTDAAQAADAQAAEARADKPLSDPIAAGPLRDALVATQRLVNKEGWAKGCIKNTKEFLLGLGAGTAEAGFSGFWAVRYSGEGLVVQPQQVQVARRRSPPLGKSPLVKSPLVKSPLAEYAGPVVEKRAPLPHAAPKSPWSPPPPPGEEKGDADGDSAGSYYRRVTLETAAVAERPVFTGPGIKISGRMPLPALPSSMRSASVDEVRNVAAAGEAGSPSAGAEKKPKRKGLTREQREHAAAVRRVGACGECKARKVRCDPSHLRGSAEPGPVSPRTVGSGSSSSPGGGGAVGPIVRKRKSESPAPPIMHMGISMLARRGGLDATDDTPDDAADDEGGVDKEVFVVA